jgi:hypothetical protein
MTAVSIWNSGKQEGSKAPTAQANAEAVDLAKFGSEASA